MWKSKIIIGIVITYLLSCSSLLMAQPGWTFDPFGKEKKPEKYEEKKLASEKTGDKKFGTVRKFLQNNTSHYNFYFNANNRINAVIERAKLSNKDDYSKLLSFYPYSLENTASQKADLDSVIYKATSGILLHDLRSDWVDDFYMLIGKSYFLKKDFDSAALTFQFINYNLFPRKKGDDGYNKIVGSNEGGSGTGSVTIADKEKRNIVQKVFTKPASRNDALIWQIKTFTQQNEFGDAAGLISILQNDKNLPQRLKNDLEEVISYWFYAQNNFDSSALHLANALSNAETKDDKSRWEYLLAQLYERTGNFDLASKYYIKAARQTTNPVMDIYARLNEAKMLRNTGNFKELDNSISNLLKMAKRDKYEAFRDIIYYSTAQLSLQKPDTTNGITFYNKSISYNTPSSGYRDKSFLQLANIAYTQKRYKDAHSFYDSLNIVANDTEFDSAVIEERKEILGRLVPKIIIIDREDSLQMLAAMPEAERNAFIKRMVKKYRKENGLKADDDFAGNTLITFADKNKAPVDLFKAAAANTGDWYFYNASLKSKGYNEFKSKWGKRTNVDNWRRKTAAEAVISGKNPDANADPDAKNPSELKSDPNAIKKEADYSFDGLMADIPLSKEKIDSSNISISKNLFEAAQIFQNELQDYEQAIVMYENFANRFPADVKIPDVYMGLSYCYGKLGNPAKAALYSNLVKTNYAGSNAAKIINNPSLLKPGQKNPEVTGRYQGIYNMFVEGNFTEAIAAKKKADSTFGNNYWSPQLLYIESVYYIKERQDSNAIAVLKNIQTLYPTSPLKDKATTMLDVLKRRAEIEKYLTDLQITRADEDQIVVVDDKAPIKVNAPANKPAEVKTSAPVITKRVMTDSIKIPDVYINKSFTLNPEKPHYVAMILDKVDGVYVNEAKNAFVRFNKESMATINVAVSRDTIDAGRSLLLFKQFDNATEALKYFDKIKKAASSEVSWLQAAKYSFIIISEENLLLLKTNKDVTSYKQLINANFGNRF
jgi:tetratricopeptide (TPR) repeat protein